MEKTIRIWDGCNVVGLLSVNQDGGSTFQGKVGGAGNSSKPDIELDPFAGLIVDHSIDHLPPVAFRDQSEGGF